MAKTAAVLGAGIQGTCVALMLEKHGYQVKLIDKSEDIINRASLNYEGRIHLGFVYGMDKTLRTGHKMIRDALRFAPYMNYLLGEVQNWQKTTSTPSMYLVAQDSMLTVVEVESYFNNLNDYFQEQTTDASLHYLDKRPMSIAKRTEIPNYLNRESIQAAFLTEELCADHLHIKNLLKRKIVSSPQISLLLNHCVTEISTKPQGFEVKCKNGEGRDISIRTDLVFNCLWESRPYFDQAMGMNDEPPHSIRIKYGLILKMDDQFQNLSSLNIVHGAYGAIVINHNAKRAFCAWYPTFMRGLMDYAPIPQAWEDACEGHISAEVIEDLKKSSLQGFQKFIPGLKPFHVLEARAGLILAEGNRDINERDSLFHTRDETPIRQKNGYYSVNTSKYTSAPGNAMVLEQMLFNNRF